MERTAFILFLIFLGMRPFLSCAGVVMAVPEAPPALPSVDENFSSSRFGAPPVKPELGVGPHYASQAVNEMESESVASNLANRKPAGLDSLHPSEQSLNPKPVSMARTGIQEVALIAGDLGFFPKTVFVTRDIPVRLFVTGASKKTLCIMMDSFQVRKQVRSQKIEEINFTPTQPGQYRFYCPVNGMEGTLLVKELTSSRGE